MNGTLLATSLAVALASACSAPVEPADPTDPAPPPPAAKPVETAPAVATPAPAAGKDFAEDLRLLFRVVACRGKEALPSNIDARIVDEHCRVMDTMLAKYKNAYVSVASPFLAKLVPEGAPTSVVYPFSGGDLVTAITTFPTATDYTTLSLELTGDPRRLRAIPPDSLEPSLRRLRAQLTELFDWEDYSRSETLKKTQRGELPGELSFFLVSLAVHGLEPVGMKFFRLEGTGALHYLTAEEINASAIAQADQRKTTWLPPDFSEAFANVEITFRKAGDPSSPLRVHRHIALNLDDEHFPGAVGVVPFLDAKGSVSAMTKAASYLLWRDNFSRIRRWLLEHAALMISDSTGIPPGFAEPAGFVGETYGSFGGSLLRANAEHNQAFMDLWAREPKRALSFRYGYLDRRKANHLVVMRRKTNDASSQSRQPASIKSQ